jgi:hypothetical protein
LFALPLKGAVSIRTKDFQWWDSEWHERFEALVQRMSSSSEDASSPS